MRKSILFLLLFFIVSSVYAEMPTIFGRAEFNDEAYRDEEYDFVYARRNWTTTNESYLKSYERQVSTTPSVVNYCIEFWAHFKNINENKRNEIEDEIDDCYNDSRTVSLDIKIYESNNDGTPGQCKPDIIRRHIIK